MVTKKGRQEAAEERSESGGERAEGMAICCTRQASHIRLLRLPVIRMGFSKDLCATNTLTATTTEVTGAAATTTVAATTAAAADTDTGSALITPIDRAQLSAGPSYRNDFCKRQEMLNNGTTALLPRALEGMDISVHLSTGTIRASS